MLAILSIVLAFVLTGLIGNHIVHKLQHRNWVSQQRVLGLHRDYDAARGLFEEISARAGKRLARMMRLTLSVRDADRERLSELVKEHDEAVREWNESLANLYVRTTFHLDHSMTMELERSIQARFYEAGQRLERLVQLRNRDLTVEQEDWTALMQRLNSTQGVLSNFNRDMLRLVKEKQVRTFEGDIIELRADTLGDFSSWDLFKALFIRAEERFRVVRSPSDLPGPFNTR